MIKFNIILKNFYYILPLELIKTILHLIFLGPIISNWSFEFTIIIKFITYWFNLIPLIGFNLFRWIFNFNLFYKIWELKSYKLELPCRRINIGNNGGSGGGGGGIDDDDGNSNIKLEFMWYSPNDIWGWLINYFSTEPNFKHMKHLINSNKKKSIIFYIHGGGFVFGSSNSHKSVILNLSKSTGLPVISVDYRLCPEFKFPTPLIDLLTSYSFLLDKNLGLGLNSSQIIIGGDSAGGNLGLSLNYYLRDYKLPQPKALILMSPWLDLTQSNPTWNTFKNFDYLQNHTDRSKSIANHYLPSQDLICHPYASPYFGKVHDLPPILIQYGTLEVLSGEIREFGLKFKGMNTKLRLEAYDDMVHVFQFFDWTRQSKLAFQSINQFICELDKLK